MLRKQRSRGSHFQARWQKKNLRDPISTNKLSVVAYTCHLNYSGSIDRRIVVQTDLSKTCMTQVVEHPPSKYKNLSSNLSTAERERERERERESSESQRVDLPPPQKNIKYIL
jgi:hypothetical protein